jgi:hypothetical protein
LADRVQSAMGMFALFSWFVIFAGVALEGVHIALTTGVVVLAGTAVVGLAVRMNQVDFRQTRSYPNPSTEYMVIAAGWLLLYGAFLGFLVGSSTFHVFSPWLPLMMGVMAGLNYRHVRRTGAALKRRRLY